MDQELVQYLDERFNGLIHGLDQRFEGIDRRFDDVNERIRYNGVLVEGLRHEIHLVAEAFTMHVQVQHVQEREYFDRKFEDTHALIRSSYGQLQQQHDQLHQRVENLERNRPA